MNSGTSARIADGSGCGEYHYADASSTLAYVYARLRHESLGEVLEEFEGQIHQDETVEVGQITVPRDKGELNVTLQWPGSDLELIVRDPLGNEVSERYPDVSLVKYERLVYLIVKDPLPGSWALSAFGVDVPEGILTYHAIASVRESVNSGAADRQPSLNTGLLILGIGFVALRFCHRDDNASPSTRGWRTANASNE